MTVSDISAQALEYVVDIEVIRNKCGRIQGGLSGELRKRTHCLEDLIRALQRKVETSRDPEFLRAQIEELKQNKRKEEKRKRELSELHEVIKELKKENRGIREEMRKIKVSIERESVSRSRRYSPTTMTMSHDVLESRKSPPEKLLDERSWPPLVSREEPETERKRIRMDTEWVLRPPLLGKSIPIPVREDLAIPSTSRGIPAIPSMNRGIPAIPSTSRGV